MSKKRIAGYLRISVDTELDRDNTSIENQREIIKNYVERTFPDAELDFYEDRDRSGYTFEQRENYQLMRPKLMNGYYNILIIKDFSRFSRRNGRGLVELEELRDAGVRIISIGDNIDYPTYDDWIQIQMRFFVNEMPVTDASKKVKGVINTKQQEGKWICAVPYGYYITNTKKMTFEVDEKAAEVVRKIFELYIDGWGYKKIANFLTDEGIPTPRMIEKERREADGAETKIKASAAWAIPSISGILTNDFYIGTLRQKKYTRTKINGSDKKLDSDENIVFENNHEAIIDVRTFAKAQEQLKARSKSNYRGVKKYDTSYSGFLFCGDCGSPMFSMSRPDLAPAYTCGTYHKRGLKGCTSHHTRTDTLDIMIKKYIERVMMNSERMIAELEQAIRNEPEMMKKSKSSIELLEVDLAKAKEEFKATKKQKIRELMKNEDNQELIEETFAEIEEELQKKIEGLEKQIAFASEHRNMTIQVNRIAKTAIEIFREILAKDKLDKTDLSLIVDRITVFENNIEIQLKADIAMLLECGTVTKELLEESDFVGKAVNFKWDTESIAKATIVQKANHRTDKAFGVNVVCEGDPLEIYTDTDGEVIFKKYSPIGELSSITAQYSEVLNRSTSLPVVVTDRDTVIACSGISRREIIDRRVSNALEDLMENRENFVYEKGSQIMKPVEGLDKSAAVAFPIIGAGDVSGSVILLLGDNGAAPTQTEIKLAQVAASFLGKQMEE